MTDSVKGALLTMFGGMCWGVSGCVGQYLFTRQGMDSTWLVPIRLFLAGLILCAFFFVKNRKMLFDPWNFKKNPRNVVDLLIYGLAGVSCCQFTYFLTIQLSSAGMGTILQDLSPVIILLVVCIQQRRGPRVFEIFSILLALVGVALVVYNGHFILKISPLGDFLTLLAAFSWAFYSLIMKKMSGRYRTTFITRKIFFYGILTILPAFILHPWQFSLSGLWQPAVWMNLLFLGVLASLVCFVVWNIILKQLGTVRASNYIYLNPLFTLIGSAVLLDEQFTVMSLMGAMLILGGVYWAGKR